MKIFGKIKTWDFVWYFPMTAGNMIFLYFRKLKPLGFFKCLFWTKTMKTFSIYPGAIWSSCFVRLGRLGLRCAQANFHLSRRGLDLEQNTICPRLAAVRRSSHYELVSLKMSSLKLGILWGALKVRNLRLSPKERGSGTSGRCIFLLILTEAPGFTLTYIHMEIAGEPPVLILRLL